MDPPCFIEHYNRVAELQTARQYAKGPQVEDNLVFENRPLNCWASPKCNSYVADAWDECSATVQSLVKSASAAVWSPGRAKK